MTHRRARHRVLLQSELRDDPWDWFRGRMIVGLTVESELAHTLDAPCAGPRGDDVFAPVSRARLTLQSKSSDRAFQGRASDTNASAPTLDSPMPKFIALLRAVNVGGRNRLTMADLRTLFETLGLESVQTILQSGNVVFRSDSRAPRKLERTLAEGARTELGLATDFFVRSAAEWDRLVGENPFAREATEAPSKLVALVLNRAPSSADVQALESSIRGRERVRAHGKHAYIYYPEGIGRSKLTAAVIERALGSPCTARNWNTVLKLQSAVA